MQIMFRYNWLVREEWYRWCEDVPEEELLRIRTGGVRGILHTLFHIIDVEWSWIRSLQGKLDFQESFESYSSLEKVRNLDAALRPEVQAFVHSWDVGMETCPFYDPQPDGKVAVDAWGEVMRHIIAHEIHHIGQLSVWAREVGKNPVSANVIGKDLIKPQLLR
ncbi:DinB family protein [Paenibacillus sp. Soil750]|uniref:DinB family protein n=1 Tax=Paenibacillus sp. Soil750 TaxID=1736398 RepID=UPI0006FF5DC9|nr:DinB family protein [Paenibacillus sp. Soil750]KRE57433.1 damage-inducible protein DinB [Paenibacillus sp. Soil750]